MPGVARQSLRRLALRGLIAALLAPALALGALDLHSTELPHAAFDGPGVVLTDARHPLAPAHLESSVAVHVPDCVACLLQSKTSCPAVAAPELESHLKVVDAGAAVVIDAPTVSLAYSLGSRAPPLA